MAGPIVEFPSFLQNKQAFHTPSFGDEDFSVENQLAQQKSAEEGSEPPAAQQVSISCTAQVALLQHPYSNSGYSPPQGYIATDSPTQLNTGPAYNSGTLQHHNTQANYPYPTAINRYPQYHSPPPPPQTLSQPQSGVGGSIGYNNSNNIVTTINSGVGSGYHPGSHLQASQHNQQQYYNSTGGYLSSLNSSPYINGGVNGGIYNNPQFPPQNYFDIPDINGDGSNLNYYNQQQLPSHLQHHYSSYIHPQQQHSSAINPAYIPTTYYNTGVMAQRDPILSTMDESRAMGYNMAGDKNSSEDSDDNVPLSKLSKGKVTKRKRGGGAANTRSGDKAGEGKKPRTPKKRRKKDPNEPVKPVSAYAMFFRDTQSAIKSENPKATFGEVSKIVASMWDGLEDEAKSEYKQRTEIAKKEYLQKLAVYKASLVSQGADGGSGSVESSPQVSPEKNIPTANNIQTTLQPPQPQLVQPTLNAPTVYQSPPHDSQPDQEQQEQTTTLVDEQQATQEDTVSSGSSNSPDQAIDQAPEMSSTVSPPHNSTVDSEECTDMVNTLPEEPMTNEPVQNNYDKEASAINTNMFYGKNEPPAASPTSVQCTRSGCERPPVDSPLWDSEYCSNQCVVDHCRDVFTAWVASRSGYASVN